MNSMTEGGPARRLRVLTGVLRQVPDLHEARRAAIRDLRAQKRTYRQIGSVIDVSPQGIWQMIDRPRPFPTQAKPDTDKEISPIFSV